MSLGALSGLPSNLSASTVTRAVVLVADHAAVAVLAGELAALVVEGVAVAVVGGLRNSADVAVLLEPAHLAVVGDVAPDQVLADAVPGRPFGPERAGVEALDRRVADLVFGEALVEHDDVRVGIAHGILAAPIAFSAGGWG